MAFLAAEVEDGTGLSTALVYEQAAAAVTWLAHAARGLTALSGASTANQDKAMLKATQVFEEWMDGKLDGERVAATQALLFPRAGCTDRRGTTFLTTETPPAALKCIRLLAEEEISTTGGIVRVVDDASIQSARSHGKSAVFRSSRGDVSQRYPEQWALVSTLFVPGRRVRRAA